MNIENILLANLTKLSGLLLAAFLAGLVGCAGNPPVDNTNQYLDRGTGFTISGLPEPAIFHHAEPRLATHVRDYLYVGPVEMNRMGKYSYYLWFGEWSSIDRVPRGNIAASANNELGDIVILLDGVPMELHDSLASGDKSRIIQQPYDAPVDSTRIAYMRVSRDQINAIAAADNIAIRVGGMSHVRTYSLWDGSVRSFGLMTSNSALSQGQQLAEISD